MDLCHGSGQRCSNTLWASFFQAVRNKHGISQSAWSLPFLFHWPLPLSPTQILLVFFTSSSHHLCIKWIYPSDGAWGDPSAPALPVELHWETLKEVFIWEDIPRPHETGGWRDSRQANSSSQGTSNGKEGNAFCFQVQYWISVLKVQWCECA